VRLSFFRLLLYCLLALLLPGRPGAAQSGSCPQVEPYLSIAAVNGVATSGSLGQPDQATVPVGGCVALRFIVVRQSGTTSTASDVTNDPNTSFSTSPAQGSFSTRNSFCAAAGDCNQDITIYGVYHDPCTGTD
jgi:hypothetical protein